MIGKIGGLAEAESIDRRLAVQDRDRRKLDAEQIERSAIQRVRFELGHGRILLRPIEDIAESAMNSAHGALGRVDRYAGMLVEIERAHVVESHDVVGMFVRKEDGVQPLKART